jgi:exopolyphosphatase / guanosine-5'-triphosphate,3'-diphosphate pyrophosphatase
MLFPVLCACIDIGSNTTRLLVARLEGERLSEVLQQREFTRIGRELRNGSNRLSEGKIAEVAEVVAVQAGLARELGTRTIRAVATAAIRGAVNRADLVAAIRTASGVEVEILSGDEEARLAWLGAARTLVPAPSGSVGVVDVGGGSSEVAVGSLPADIAWSGSYRIGSGLLADRHLRSDPPAATELQAAREHVGEALGHVEAPTPEVAVAVGGSATSLRRLVGAVVDPQTLAQAIRVLAAHPAEEVARRLSLDPERVRLLPGGILILEECSRLLGRPLRIGRGGLREGILLELTGGGAEYHRDLGARRSRRNQP